MEAIDRLGDALLHLFGEGGHLSGPCVAALNAGARHDREALHDEQTAIVVAFRALNRQRLIGVRHGLNGTILATPPAPIKGAVSKENRDDQGT